MECKMIGPVRVEVEALLLDDEHALASFHYCVQLADSQLSEWSALPCDR
jgi:hypothetical protein